MAHGTSLRTRDTAAALFGRPCLAGACAAALAAGWRALAEPSSMLAHPCAAAGLWLLRRAQVGRAPRCSARAGLLCACQVVLTVYAWCAGTFFSEIEEVGFSLD